MRGCLLIVALLLEGCTIQASDSQLRSETQQAFKTNTQAIETIGKALEKLIEEVEILKANSK